MTWDEVVALALGLPEVEIGTYYGDPVPMLRGKALLAPGRHPEDAFVLMLPNEVAAMLIEAEPAHFYQTPHYAGWPAVLVRWTTPRETASFWIARAWDHRATAKLRKAHGRA